MFLIALNKVSQDKDFVVKGSLDDRAVSLLEAFERISERQSALAL
jgi:hypothetical protein